MKNTVLLVCMLVAVCGCSNREKESEETQTEIKKLQTEVAELRATQTEIKKLRTEVAELRTENRSRGSLETAIYALRNSLPTYQVSAIYNAKDKVPEIFVIDQKTGRVSNVYTGGATAVGRRWLKKRIEAEAPLW